MAENTSDDAGKNKDANQQPEQTQPNSAKGDGQSARADSQEDADLIQVINDQQAKIVELTNMVQRNRADFENYRKHTEADLERARQTGAEKAVKKLLPIIDSLDAAAASVPDNLKDDNWTKGFIATHKNLDKMMDNLGLKRQEVKEGDLFDHNQHQAIDFEDGDGEEDVIAKVLMPGYVYNGKVLRPAMVKVKKQ